jgi:uroporphyrin-III C-methyltransferase / precorrin-2 dehydrogenase / sirohydrochlorin ferrochelatase
MRASGSRAATSPVVRLRYRPPEHGMTGSTPTAVVEKATLAEQRVVEGTLLTVAEEAKARRIAPPALLIVGEVVLRAKLGWFGRTKAESGTDHVMIEA